jgi:hypothetical protein
MLRMNLMRSLRPAEKPGKSLLSRREAVVGLVLLVTAFAMLTYLASGPPAEQPPPPAAPAPVVKQETPQEPPTPPPPATAPEPEACQISGVKVLKQEGAVTVVVEANAPLKHTSMELSNPERIAVDITDCPGAGTTQAVEDAVVQRVRSGQPREGVFRLVVDVAAMPRYEVHALEKGLEIRILGGKP